MASLLHLEKIAEDRTDPVKILKASEAFRIGVINQLDGYLRNAGSSERHDGRILGVAIIGNQVALREWSRYDQAETEGVDQVGQLTKTGLASLTLVWSRS